MKYIHCTQAIICIFTSINFSRLCYLTFLPLLQAILSSQNTHCQSQADFNSDRLRHRNSTFVFFKNNAKERKDDLIRNCTSLADFWLYFFLFYFSSFIEI